VDDVATASGSDAAVASDRWQGAAVVHPDGNPAVADIDGGLGGRAPRMRRSGTSGLFHAGPTLFRNFWA
jgi:hypothetical protein